MRKGLVRAGWALTFAGSLGLAGQASAQPAAPPQGKVHQEKPRAVPVAMTTITAKLVEMQVEMAWLADPVTFPYQLAAFVEGNTLVVGGQIADETVRKRVMDLAVQYAHLNLIDKLMVTNQPPQSPAPTAIDELQRSASASLTQGFPRFARDVQVKAEASGRLLVSGMVPCAEEKVAVSRRLSQLTGCTCVLNQAQVARVVRDGKSCMVVSADGQQLVSDAAVSTNQATEAPVRKTLFPLRQNTAPVTVTTVSAPRKDDKSISRPVVAPQVSQTAAMPASQRDADRAMLTPPAPSKATERPVILPSRVNTSERIAASEPAMPASPAMAPSLPITTTSPFTPAKQNTAMMADPPRSPYVVAAAPVPASARSTDRTSKLPTAPSIPTPASSPYGHMSAQKPVAKTEVARATFSPATTVSSTPPPAPVTTTMPPPAPRTASASATPMPRTTTVAQTSAPTLPSKPTDRAMGTASVQTVDTPRTPAPATANPAVSRVAAPITSTPARSEVLKPAKPEPVAPSKPSIPTSPQFATQIRARVQAICGRSVKDVTVEDLKNGTIKIRFAVKNEKEAQPLVEKIVQIPELGPYKVDVEVSVK